MTVADRAASCTRTAPIDELAALGTVELAARIARRELSPVEVARAFIARIERVNPVLNALVVERFESAMDEARAAEQEIVAGRKPGPLHGVPFTQKEMLALAGHPHTAGSLYRSHIVAGEDALATARLRRAGAIPLGLSNVSEVGMWWESANPVYGRTGNPYDPRRSSGGSSGGEGSLVGAGASGFGVGTDVGGSIRIPAFFCGAFAHKPTGGLAPLQGHATHQDGAIGERYCTLGPITRRAGDLMPLLRIMVGDDPAAADHPRALADPAKFSFAGRTVHLAERLAFPARKPNAAQRAALVRAVKIFEDAGARIEPIDHKTLGNGFTTWSALMGEAQSEPFAATMTSGGEPSVLGEILRALVGRGRHTWPALLLAGMENLKGLLGNEGAARMAAAARALRDSLEKTLGREAILLMPTFPAGAPRHNFSAFRPIDFAYTGLFNVLEFPATTVPAGLDPKGLPTGVQVVAARGGDALTIAAALLLEEGGCRWVPPALDPGFFSETAAASATRGA